MEAKTDYYSFPKVFVDTSFWVASFNSQDENHFAAQQWLKQLKKNPVILVTSDYIIVETLNFLVSSSKMTTSGLNLSYRKTLAEGFYNSWFKHCSPYRELIRVDIDIWEKATQMYFQYRDKEFSFTDCTSFSIMEKLGIFQAATFDHHFSQAGKIIVTKTS